MGNEFSMRRSYGPTPKYDRVLAYEPPKDYFVIIGGSCSVESESQVQETADFVASCGTTHLRGGCFRAGTFPPKTFGWIDTSIIKAYYSAAKTRGLENIIEILDYRDIDLVSEYSTAFQVGARQMQNYTLLNEVGMSGKPVFLKRNMGATIDEWLGAAEYILKAGCKELYLIERGSSAFHREVRWTPAVHMIPAVKSICNVPVIFDASHACGRRDIVPQVCLAGVAAGANGVLIETHKTPVESISDADQGIDFNQYQDLIVKIHKVRKAIE